MWLLRQGTTAVVVDPGDAAPVLAYLAREGMTLTTILATHHHHGDHVGGNTTNPFLRANVPAVKAAAEAHAGRPLANDVEAFAALRAWKNAS